MPWTPELFSAPVLERWLEARHHERVVDVPYFDGLVTGETDALVGSFAGEPELYDPIRGRVKGDRAFRTYVAETNAWLARRHVAVEDVELVIEEERAIEEVVLHLDGSGGRVGLPVALVTEHRDGRRIGELRIYHSSRPLTGRPAGRPPLLQHDPEVRPSGVVAEYHAALAAGDVEAVVATFEADGCVREAAGGDHAHRGREALRAFHARVPAGDGGLGLEPCALVDDGRVCALEYNVVRRGTTDVPPEAGVAVFVRGASGRLAAVRFYDDALAVATGVVTAGAERRGA
jgi:hypothetical protein